MDIETEAMNEVYDLAKKDSETKYQQLENEVEAIREESIALGVLQKINYDNAHNELLKYITLHHVKQNKEYKKGGMTWEQFCEATGEQRRTVENKLKDIHPFVENFSENFSGLAKVPFNKIRLLGRTVSENFSEIKDGELVIDNTIIPLTPDNKDEIEAAIDTLIETHKKEKKELKNKLNRARKNTDKIIEEETRGLKHERDALIKEVDRLKPLDLEEKDITWCEEHLKEMQGLCVDFEKLVRKMAMDKRIHEDMHVQAKCEAMINMMARASRDLQREWDEEFNSDDGV